jgi:hypothetical protein
MRFSTKFVYIIHMLPIPDNVQLIITIPVLLSWQLYKSDGKPHVSVWGDVLQHSCFLTGSLWCHQSQQSLSTLTPCFLLLLQVLVFCFALYFQTQKSFAIPDFKCPHFQHCVHCYQQSFLLCVCNL